VVEITNVVHAIQTYGRMGAYRHLPFTSALDGSGQLHTRAKGPPVTTELWKRTHSSACTSSRIRQSGLT